MKAAYEALGGDPDQLELLIMQFVHLVARRRARADVQARAASSSTLDELVEEIGVDAARWFLLARSHDTTVDLDLDLAREQSDREPRLLRAVRARADRLDAAQGGRASASPARWPSGAGAELALHPSERALIQQLLAFPRRGRRGRRAPRAAPHRRLRAELAQAFTAFYRDCHVVGATEQPFRLALSVAAQRCSRGRWTCSASPRRSRCERPRPQTRLSAGATPGGDRPPAFSSVRVDPPCMKGGSGLARSGPRQIASASSTAAPNIERQARDRADEARRRSAVDAGLVDDGVALAAGDEPAVDRDGEGDGDDQREASAAPEQQLPSPASIAPGTATMIALSTSSIVAIENVSEASAIGMTAASARPGAQQRQAGQPVAEEERQRDRQDDRAAVFEKPSAVPIAMPRISPIAQPVRQCSVAEMATAVSAEPEVGIW